MKKGVKYIISAAVFAVFIAGAVLLYNDLSEKTAPHPVVSQQAEKQVSALDFTVTTFDGRSDTFSAHAGKPVIMNYWASWCSPCVRELPEFEEAYKKYGGEVDFMMVGLIDQNATVERAQRIIDENGYTFPVYLDTQGSVYKAYTVGSIPLTVFIDSDGMIHRKAVGRLDGKTLDAYIEELLENK